MDRLADVAQVTHHAHKPKLSGFPTVTSVTIVPLLSLF